MTTEEERMAIRRGKQRATKQAHREKKAAEEKKKKERNTKAAARMKACRDRKASSTAG